MKSIGCNLEQITWSIVTHFHMDHAGLISEFIERGIKCFILENQLKVIDAMEKTIEKNYKQYKGIDKARLHHISTMESRAVLKDIGIQGEVVVTDYHSPDSITLITDELEAIVGDLPPATQMTSDDTHFWKNMELLRTKGVRTIYPSHAQEYKMAEID